MKPLRIFIQKSHNRYFGTGDYFTVAADKLGFNQDPPDEEYDVGIFFDPRGNSAPCKRYLYYERDAHREKVWNDKNRDDVFFSQLSVATEDRVVLHAANPVFHKRTEKPVVAAVFVGREYPDRNEFIRAVEKETGLEVYADGKTPQQYVKLLNRGSIILNVSQMNEINRRVFEAMAIGCCVTDRVDYIDTVGKDGQDLFTFTRGDVKDCARVINMLKKHPKLVEKVHKSGRKLIETTHNYQNRLLELLKKGDIDV